MKGVESALTGTGDVDSAAPLERWPDVARTFAEHALARGFGPVIVCDHVPFVRHLVALDPGDRLIMELDVNRRKIFLGATLFGPGDLLALAIMDPRGFRRLRPGAEGVLRLVQNGARRGGRVNWPEIHRKGIVALLAEDPDGVEGFARLFGGAARSVCTLSRQVIAGTWDRRAMLAVEGWCLRQGLADPTGLVARARVRLARRRCPVLQCVLQFDRHVPVDRESWLRRVEREHTLHETVPEVAVL